MDKEQFEIQLYSYSQAVVNEILEGAFIQAEELQVNDSISYVSSILGTCLLISINQLVRKCDEEELRMIQGMFEATVNKSKERYLEEQDEHIANRTPDRMDDTPTVLDD